MMHVGSVLCGLQFTFTRRHLAGCPLKPSAIGDLAEINRELAAELRRSEEIRERIRNSESATILAGIVDMLEGQVGAKPGPDLPKPPEA